ncbi:MAG: hypothetical protein WAQ28_06210 [Bacteroidia bacterium]
MIIGETFKSDFEGYEEDSYDYLFKRKTKEERQQKRTERKEKRQEKRTEKQISASEGKRKRPIFGNFGLFDKNKKRNSTSTSGTSTSSSLKKEHGETAGLPTSEERKIGMAGAAAAMEDKSKDGTTPESQSGARGTESATLEARETDKTIPKEAGFGPMLGFAFLGIALLLAGIAVVRGGKKPISELQPMKVAA